MRVSSSIAAGKYGLAVAAMATLLSGCASLFEAPSHMPASFETIETFYRPLAANAAQPFVRGAAVQIAELRPSVAPQPGDWMTCVRSWQDGRQVYVAVFFRDRAVYDARQAMMIDRCTEGPYPAMTGVQKAKW